MMMEQKESKSQITPSPKLRFGVNALPAIM